jgi:hypothetical protein
MAYEPAIDDPIALDIYRECDDCGIEHDSSRDCDEFASSEPDEMWDDFFDE